jgi:uncharacterized phage protein (TIGR02216 family)
MDSDDGWNWPWLLFLGMRELRISEEAFWNMTPCKYYTLLDCAIKLHGGDKVDKTQSEIPEGYIDQIKGW